LIHQLGIRTRGPSTPQILKAGYNLWDKIEDQVFGIEEANSTEGGEEEKDELKAIFEAGELTAIASTHRFKIWEREQKAIKEATHPDSEFLACRYKVEKMDMERHRRVNKAEAAAIADMKAKKEVVMEEDPINRLRELINEEFLRELRMRPVVEEEEKAVEVENAGKVGDQRNEQQKRKKR
jgi:hypothetical protein